LKQVDDFGGKIGTAFVGIIDFIILRRESIIAVETFD